MAGESAQGLGHHRADTNRGSAPAAECAASIVSVTRPIIAALGIGIAVILTGCSISTAPNPDPGLGALQGDVAAVRSTATPDPAGTTRALTQLRTDVARLQKDNQLSTARTTSILTPPHVKGTYGFAILLPSDVPGRRHYDNQQRCRGPGSGDEFAETLHVGANPFQRSPHRLLPLRGGTQNPTRNNEA